jgi:RNA-directed DNA polymerase
MVTIDPWRRMSCVPSGAALAASKRPPSRSPLTSPLAPLVTDEPWLAAVELFRTRNPRRAARIADYERLLERGDHLRIGADVLACRHQPAPPVEGRLNKADGRKKRIFQYPPADELLFRTVNRLLQPLAAELASPWCHSFLPGGGARAAFRGLLAHGNVGDRAALRLDVRDYFNSIEVDDLLGRLPDELGCGAVGTLLRSALLDCRVERAGHVVDGGQKGIMAGTPIAPLLATLYLRDLDAEVAATGAIYARYSDDIIVLAPAGDLLDIEHLVRRRLNERGLAVNESKSAQSPPGEPWDFLGFRYQRGAIDLAPITVRKLRGRTTRLARGLLRWRERTAASPERALRAFVRRTNMRLYGVRAERASFSWGTWFLPMLHGPDRLAELDRHVQREARFVATGRRTARTRDAVPYARLGESGYLPLVTAFWAVQESPMAYDALVARRTGLEVSP